MADGDSEVIISEGDDLLDLAAFPELEVLELDLDAVHEPGGDFPDEIGRKHRGNTDVYGRIGHALGPWVVSAKGLEPGPQGISFFFERSDFLALLLGGLPILTDASR